MCQSLSLGHMRQMNLGSGTRTVSTVRSQTLVPGRPLTWKLGLAPTTLLSSGAHVLPPVPGRCPPLITLANTWKGQTFHCYQSDYFSLHFLDCDTGFCLFVFIYSLTVRVPFTVNFSSLCLAYRTTRSPVSYKSTVLYDLGQPSAVTPAPGGQSSGLLAAALPEQCLAHSWQNKHLKGCSLKVN